MNIDELIEKYGTGRISDLIRFSTQNEGIEERTAAYKVAEDLQAALNNYWYLRRGR